MHGSHHLYVIGIVTQVVTEDNNPVTEENNPEEAPIFVIEDNWRQLVTTVNMAGFRTVSDFLQFLNKLGDDHRHIGLLERIRLDSLLPGYEVVYKHVDRENEVVIKHGSTESKDSTSSNDLMTTSFSLSTCLYTTS